MIQERCDKCGAKTISCSEIRFDVELWNEFLRTFEFHKESEDGAFIFRFCLSCIYEDSPLEVDTNRRVTNLVKESLGIFVEAYAHA